MVDLIQGIGIFFALEGGANLVWWHFNPPTDQTNKTMQMVWEAGRVLRTVLGVALVVFG